MQLKKEIWAKANLSESVFRNNKINIDSNDIRESDDIRELKAVAEYLQSHLIEVNNLSKFMLNERLRVRHRNYIFTQNCLKSQVDWEIFKLRTKQIIMNEQEKITSEQVTYLKSIILAQLLLEANESLVNTNVYKQSLKQQINRMNGILEPIVRQEFDGVYNSEPEMTTNILNKIDSIVGKIASYQIEELVILEAVVDKYENNKEWFLEHTASDFLKID